MGENVFKYTTIKHLVVYLLCKISQTSPQKLPPEQSGLCALDGDFRVQENVKNL